MNWYSFLFYFFELYLRWKNRNFFTFPIGLSMYFFSFIYSLNIFIGWCITYNDYLIDIRSTIYMIISHLDGLITHTSLSRDSFQKILKIYWLTLEWGWLKKCFIRAIIVSINTNLKLRWTSCFFFRNNLNGLFNNMA